MSQVNNSIYGECVWQMVQWGSYSYCDIEEQETVRSYVGSGLHVAMIEAAQWGNRKITYTYECMDNLNGWESENRFPVILCVRKQCEL